MNNNNNNSFLSHIVYIIITLFSLYLVKDIYAADRYIKYPNNPVLTPTEGSWDQGGVSMPTVIHDGSSFKMWYGGFNNSRWQIGLAESQDGINWTKYPNNPVLSRLQFDNKDVHDPIVIFDSNLNKYVMWYVASEDGGLRKFNLYRALSDNGYDWTTDPINPVFIGTQTWDLNYVTGPFVLKENSNSYKMWYMGAGSGKWLIGLATSSDGINWIANNQNPILQPIYSWEGNDLGNPYIFLNQNNYNIYYVSQGLSINYGNSTDGVSWTRNEINTPILSKGDINEVDGIRLGGAKGQYIGNNHYLWYSALGQFNGSQKITISLAYQNDPFATPSATPTPSPTPSPSSTPTPTPPPTPSPVDTKKVVFIPGLGASWNLEDIAFCKSTPNAQWKLNIFGEKAYVPFLYALKKNDYDVSVFNYDWRKDIRENISNLSAHINSVANPGEKISLIGHSMGGLVGRSYLNETFGEGKVSTFITIGTPHKGAATTYPFWAGAENNYFSKELKIASSLLIHACKVTYNISNLNAVHTYFPSVQNMLPTFDYLRDKKNNMVKSVLDMNHKNNYFPDSFSFPYFSIRLGTLSGYGEDTVLELETKNPTSKEITRGEWLDGKTLNSKSTKNGDGTVLNLSSVLDDAENITIQGNHTEIIQSRTGVNAILGMLGNTHSLRSSLTVPEKNNSSKTNELSHGTIVVSYPADIWISQNGKKIRKDENGILFFDKPLTKKEELTIIPKDGKNTRLYVGQFTSKGDIQWITYEFKNKSQFKKKLHLMKDTILNNPLE